MTYNNVYPVNIGWGNDTVKNCVWTIDYHENNKIWAPISFFVNKELVFHMSW
jgi:hypothetical protein